MVHLLEDFQPVTTTQLVQKKVCIHRNWTSRHLFCWSYKSLSKDSFSGWTPQTFTSSRKSRAEVKKQSIYSFLDDDEKAVCPISSFFSAIVK